MYDELNMNSNYNTYPIFNNRSEKQPEKVFSESLANALELIRESVMSEKEDELFYDYLLKIATSEEDKNIIESIRNDERNHNKMFRQIYFELTGIILPKFEDEEYKISNLSYSQALEKALMGELSAIERYRIILGEMLDRKHYNMMMEIMTDELKHASKYNFLISKNFSSLNRR